MMVVEKNPVPIYEAVCEECKSKIQYRKSEVHFTGYITCPVCGMAVWASTIMPVKMEVERSMSKEGTKYIFDSAPQPAYDAWRRPIKLCGRHELEKVKDTFMDVLHGRSWYLADGEMLLYVQRGGYVEERCLMEVEDETD